MVAVEEGAVAVQGRRAAETALQRAPQAAVSAVAVMAAAESEAAVFLALAAAPVEVLVVSAALAAARRAPAAIARVPTQLQERAIVVASAVLPASAALPAAVERSAPSGPGLD